MEKRDPELSYITPIGFYEERLDDYGYAVVQVQEAL